MCKFIAKLISAMVLAVVAVAVVFMAGMRAKSPPVLTAVRRVNRSVSNPQAMKTAGTPGAYASVIRHVGRTTGQAYETPVGAVATEDGFVIALPYGTQADWLKNVLASGTATIVDEGETYQVDQPEVVPTSDALDHFPPSEQRAHRLFAVDQTLKVRRVEPADAAEQVVDPA
jgi:deazaflavin-dependent oxidoreductase (nitroreductase family)